MSTMPTRGHARVRLRPTMLSDLDFVGSVEHDPANRPFITPWERVQHEGAVRFPDFRHFIIEAGDGYPSAGFVILQGCRNPHGSVELKRIVLQPQGPGLRPRLRAPARADGVPRPRRAPLLARREERQHARAGALPQRRLRRGRAPARERAQRRRLRLADRDVAARARVRRARRRARTPRAPTRPESPRRPACSRR